MSKFRKICITVFLVIIVTVLYGCPKKSSESNDQIVIGHQGAHTGNIAFVGLQTLEGTKLAVEEINAKGGINGKDVKLIYFDSRGEKPQAVNVANRLLTSDVCGVIGDPNSGAYFATRDVYERGKTVVISSGATAEGITTDRLYVFRNTLLDKYGMPVLIDYALNKKGFEKFILMTAVNNEFSVGVSKVFRDAAEKGGVKIVGEQTLSDGDTDLSAQITSLRGKDIDAIFFSGYYNEAALILLELKKQGLDIALFGADGFQSPDLWKVAKDTAVGTIFYAGFTSDAGTDKINEFNSKMFKKGLKSDGFAAQAYDATKLLLESIEKSGIKDCSSETDRNKIRETLAATENFDGIAGMMSFDDNRDAIKKPFLIEVYQIDNGTISTRIVD